MICSLQHNKRRRTSAVVRIESNRFESCDEMRNLQIIAISLDIGLSE